MRNILRSLRRNDISVDRAEGLIEKLYVTKAYYKSRKSRYLSVIKSKDEEIEILKSKLLSLES